MARVRTMRRKKLVGKPPCKACGTTFKAYSTSALYCPSCRKYGGAVSPSRLLNFAISLLGITASDLKEKFRKHNLGEDLQE